MNYIKENWKRYLHSTVITFLSIFLPLLLVELKTHTFEELQVVGWLSLGVAMMRLVGKAMYEILLILIEKLLQVVKK